VDRRTATERNLRCRPELGAAARHMSCAATAQRTKAKAGAPRQEPPFGLSGSWKKAGGRSFYRALGCGDGVAGVPVVVGAFSTVHVIALRSYLWPGAFFNASFVVFMTG
jgi:hypothetical protein